MHEFTRRLHEVCLSEERKWLMRNLKVVINTAYIYIYVVFMSYWRCVNCVWLNKNKNVIFVKLLYSFCWRLMFFLKSKIDIYYWLIKSLFDRKDPSVHDSEDNVASLWASELSKCLTYENDKNWKARKSKKQEFKMTVLRSSSVTQFAHDLSL